MIEERTEDILNTPFYIYRGSHGLWIGIATPLGVIAFRLDETDWLEWLRTEITKCQRTEVPASIKAFIEGLK